MAAWNTGINLLYIMSGAMVAMAGLSLAGAFLTLRRLSVRRDAPAAVYRNQPFRVHLRIENHKAILPVWGLRIEHADAPGRVAGYVMHIPPRRAAMLSIEQVFSRRGVYPLPPLRLSTTFPFGFLLRACIHSDDQEIVVYPRVRPVRTHTVEQSPGARYAPRNPTGEGDEFFALRDYLPGDDVRRIAWRVSARRGAWVVRELTRDNSRTVIFLLDTNFPAPPPEGFEEHFEDAVELVASLGVTLLSRQYIVGLEAPGHSVEHGEGPSQQKRLLEALARVAPARPQDAAVFAQRARNIEHMRATVICVSPDPARWGRRDGGALRVLDPREVLHA
jgi:uncharacterized protein (DUF58 family)